MFIANFCVYFAFVTVAFAKPFSASFAVHERRDTPPSGFTSNGSANESSQLILRIALTSNNLAGLEKALYKTAFVNNGVIREHLTKEEVEQFVWPTNDTITKVTEWLSSEGIDFTTASSGGDWLKIKIDVGTANRLLNADFLSFSDDSTGKEVIRTLSYSIPTPLQSHIQFIHPTVAYVILLVRVFKFPIKAIRTSLSLSSKQNLNALRNSQTLANRGLPSNCSEQITPSCLADLYDFPLSTLPQTASTLGIAEFENGFPQESDLMDFLEVFRPDIPSSLSFFVQSVDGGGNLSQSPAEAGIDANLNVQYTIGLVPEVPVEVFSVGDPDGINGLLDLLNFTLSQPTLPQVLLIPFSFDEDTIPVPILNSLCYGYLQLGARGISVIVPSGDGGTPGEENETCATFRPFFPSTCPYVTSVGATTGLGPEMAVSYSLGGFSNVFSTPSYQLTAVEHYINITGNDNSTNFNTSGRAFPDTSVHGNDIVFIFQAQGLTIDTTITSATIFASMIAFLNSVLLSKGHPVLGFLNPLIYTQPSGFDDIKLESDPACNTTGFSVVDGWDPRTGVGTLNVTKQLQIIADGF
ncbi:hypothetical protein Clacol_001022 [Clathrus columnatus]|uniref:Peptidase S53 domain-containing protein n=1 Tax=Clathrus columnatus TaxID=1419009 RepID=A0AAV4ZXH7_9AGAM|nr:hypothetical protein Clacol_001022 [Clathrus columnatus]